MLTLLIIIFIPSLASQLFSVIHFAITPLLIAVTFLSSIAMVLYLKSFQVKNISFSSIFQSISIPVSTILGIFIFHESTTYFKFGGILLILISIIILNYKNAVLEKNHFYGFLAGLIFGICYVLDKTIVLTIEPLVYMFWTFLLAAVFGFLVKPKSVISSLKGKGIDAYRLVIFSGISYFLFNFFTYTAYRLGAEVGKVDAINNTQVFLIILFEFFILKQKTTINLFMISPMKFHYKYPST